MALFVNEATLLPVLVPLAPTATLLERFPFARAETLADHGASPAFIAAERREMTESRLAKTANRSVVGIMNEFAYLGGASQRAEAHRRSSSCRCASPRHPAGRSTSGTSVPTAS